MLQGKGRLLGWKEPEPRTENLLPSVSHPRTRRTQPAGGRLLQGSQAGESTSQSCSGLGSGWAGLSGLLLSCQDNHRSSQCTWLQRGLRYRLLATSDHLCDLGKSRLCAVSGLGESRVGSLRLPESTRDRCGGCSGLGGLRQSPFLGSGTLTHREEQAASHLWGSPAFEGRTRSRLPRRACPSGEGLG